MALALGYGGGHNAKLASLLGFEIFNGTKDVLVVWQSEQIFFREVNSLWFLRVILLGIPRQPLPACTRSCDFSA